VALPPVVLEIILLIKVPMVNVVPVIRPKKSERVKIPPVKLPGLKAIAFMMLPVALVVVLGQPVPPPLLLAVIIMVVLLVLIM
jgi:hypothetical protein